MRSVLRLLKFLFFVFSIIIILPYQNISASEDCYECSIGKRSFVEPSLNCEILLSSKKGCPQYGKSSCHHECLDVCSCDLTNSKTPYLCKNYAADYPVFLKLSSYQTIAGPDRKGWESESRYNNLDCSCIDEKTHGNIGKSFADDYKKDIQQTVFSYYGALWLKKLNAVMDFETQYMKNDSVFSCFSKNTMETTLADLYKNPKCNTSNAKERLKLLFGDKNIGVKDFQDVGNLIFNTYKNKNSDSSCMSRGHFLKVAQHPSQVDLKEFFDLAKSKINYEAIDNEKSPDERLRIFRFGASKLQSNPEFQKYLSSPVLAYMMKSPGLFLDMKDFVAKQSKRGGVTLDDYLKKMSLDNNNSLYELHGYHCDFLVNDIMQLACSDEEPSIFDEKTIDNAFRNANKEIDRDKQDRLYCREKAFVGVSTAETEKIKKIVDNDGKFTLITKDADRLTKNEGQSLRNRVRDILNDGIKKNLSIEKMVESIQKSFPRDLSRRDRLAFISSVYDDARRLYHMNSDNKDFKTSMDVMTAAFDKTKGAVESSLLNIAHEIKPSASKDMYDTSSDFRGNITRSFRDYDFSDRMSFYFASFESYPLDNVDASCFDSFKKTVCAPFEKEFQSKFNEDCFEALSERIAQKTTSNFCSNFNPANANMINSIIKDLFKNGCKSTSSVYDVVDDAISKPSYSTGDVWKQSYVTTSKNIKSSGSLASVTSSSVVSSPDSASTGVASSSSSPSVPAKDSSKPNNQAYQQAASYVLPNNNQWSAATNIDTGKSSSNNKDKKVANKIAKPSDDEEYAEDEEESDPQTLKQKNVKKSATNIQDLAKSINADTKVASNKNIKGTGSDDINSQVQSSVSAKSEKDGLPPSSGKTPDASVKAGVASSASSATGSASASVASSAANVATPASGDKVKALAPGQVVVDVKSLEDKSVQLKMLLAQNGVEVDKNGEGIFYIGDVPILYTIKKGEVFISSKGKEYIKKLKDHNILLKIQAMSSKKKISKDEKEGSKAAKKLEGKDTKAQKNDAASKNGERHQGLKDMLKSLRH